jgi:hypothetical protein
MYPKFIFHMPNNIVVIFNFVQGVSIKRGIKELNIKTMKVAFQENHQIFKILVSGGNYGG